MRLSCDLDIQKNLKGFISNYYQMKSAFVYRYFNQRKFINNQFFVKLKSVQNTGNAIYVFPRVNKLIAGYTWCLDTSSTSGKLMNVSVSHRESILRLNCFDLIFRFRVNRVRSLKYQVTITLIILPHIAKDHVR